MKTQASSFLRVFAIWCVMAPGFSARAQDSPSQPAFESTNLARWILHLRDKSTDDAWGSFRPRTNVCQALKAMGPNVLPFLVEWLREDDSWRRIAPVDDRDIRDSENIPSSTAVLAAFHILGPQAESSLPELSLTALDAARSCVQTQTFKTFQLLKDCVVAMTYIGSNAAPALIEVAHALSPRKDLQWMVIQDFGLLRGQGSAVIPALLDWTQDIDPSVRWAATFALGGIRSQPTKVVPVLCGLLKDPDGKVRFNAAAALVAFGADAQPALNALRSATNDPNAHVRDAVDQALRIITSSTNQAK